MSFAEHKFRALDSPQQAKKLADRLAKLLTAENGQQADALLFEYRELLASAQSEVRAAAQGLAIPESARQVAREELRAVYDAYLHWRQVAGLGPERSVSEAVQARNRPAAESGKPDESAQTIARVPYGVWLHNLRSGHNVGAIIRTAEYFGLERIYLSGYTPGPDQRAVQAAAMGCEQWIACERLDQANGREPKLPANLPLIALESPELARDPELAGRHYTLANFAWPERAVIVPGNEELGVPRSILERATVIVSISGFGRKTSLNVAAAFAVVAADLRAKLALKTQAPDSPPQQRGES